MSGPLTQSADRGADNAKVVSSTLTQNTVKFFLPYPGSVESLFSISYFFRT